MKTLTATVGVLAVVALPLAGREYAPRVVSEHVADCYSLRTFAEFPRWRDLEGDARAWELYRYLADTETGLFHMNEVIEGTDTLSEYVTVRDPVKIINVYGYAYCGILGPVMAGIAEGVGLGPARTVSLPDWHHMTSEVHYDGAWHYLDLDIRAAFRRPDGRLASLAEARNEPGLWTGRGPLFFPNDPLDKTREVYRKTPVHYHHDYHGGAHTMDYVLRQGESFSRWWHPRGGRWNHTSRYNSRQWLMGLLEKPPRGPKPNHRHFTVHNHGNGRFDYDPDLTNPSTDVEDGALEMVNLAPGEGGLVLTDPGGGHIVFEIQSPYVIVPLVGDPTTGEDDREASVVELDGDGVVGEISLDGGDTWRQVATGNAAVDLTRWVAGTYGYQLRLTVSPGDVGMTRVRSLRVTTWVQVAPASLPDLKAGLNRLEYRTGDHYGLRTRVRRIDPDSSKPDEFLRVMVVPPADYDPERKTARVRGTCVVRVDALPGSRIAWLSLGGSFRTHQGEAAARTANRIEYATTVDGPYTTVHQSDVPTYCNHWHTNVDEEVRLERPVETVFVRYTGDPALNRVRIAAHCIDAEPRPSPAIEVTHHWRDGVARRRERVRLTGAGHYSIDAGEDPWNEAITIAVPSDGPRGVAQAAPDQQTIEPPDADPDLPDWVGPMRRVHARFTGHPGVFAQFGDSITDSRAFWYGLQWKKAEASNQMMADFALVNSHMLKDCWDRKGPRFGNQGRQTVGWARKNIVTWLRSHNPEAAIVMFGTNDLNSIPVERYEQTTREVLQTCLENGTVPIVSTIPPRHRFEEKSAQFAEAVRRLASELRIPLVDFHAEIIRRRPDDWNGALDQFNEYKGYDVPTLIARDGVHPSNPKAHTGTYSEEALRCNGFGLRNYLVLKAYADVIRYVLAQEAR